MTIAEQLRQEGRQDGMREGMQEEAREFVLDALEIKFGIVPEKVKQQIKGIENIKILEKLHKDAIKVNALDEFINIIRGS